MATLDREFPLYRSKRGQYGQVHIVARTQEEARNVGNLFNDSLSVIVTAKGKGGRPCLEARVSGDGRFRENQPESDEVRITVRPTQGAITGVDWQGPELDLGLGPGFVKSTQDFITVQWPGFPGQNYKGSNLITFFYAPK